VVYSHVIDSVNQWIIHCSGPKDIVDSSGVSLTKKTLIQSPGKIERNVISFNELTEQAIVQSNEMRY